jgi:glutamate---cysteine ligase / carboxylate-amine ligase
LIGRAVGVEEEFLLVSDVGRALTDDGEGVVEEAGIVDPDGQFEHELKRSQVELGSSPTASIIELRDDLRSLRRELSQAARARGSRLIASGTAPHVEDARVTREHRYLAMTESYGMVARQQVTCGMHVHVDIKSRSEGVHVIRELAPWLPLLTALSANSPFYAGQDTGYHSYRSLLWGQWPTAGALTRIDGPAGYDLLVQQLITVGAARDTGMIYFDARLSANYPTVEIRVCDVCPSPDVAIVVAALARGLVAHVAASPASTNAPPELVRAAGWRAARDGMSGELVDLVSGRPRLAPAWDLVARLVERVTPQLDAVGDLDVVTAGLSELRTAGTGAERQRAAYDRRGSLDDVLDSTAVSFG